MARRPPEGDRLVLLRMIHPSWSGQRGSNSLPPPWQGGALPDELCPRKQGEVYQTFSLLSSPVRNFFGEQAVSGVKQAVKGRRKAGSPGILHAGTSGLVRVGRLELPASCSQSKRATNCATPGNHGKGGSCALRDGQNPRFHARLPLGAPLFYPLPLKCQVFSFDSFGADGLGLEDYPPREHWTRDFRFIDRYRPGSLVEICNSHGLHKKSSVRCCQKRWKMI